MNLNEIIQSLELELALSHDELIFNDPFDELVIKRELSAPSQPPLASSPPSEQGEVEPSTFHNSIAPAPANTDTTKEVDKSIFSRGKGWSPRRNQLDLSAIDSAFDLEAYNCTLQNHEFYKEAGNTLLFGAGPTECQLMIVSAWPFDEDIIEQKHFAGNDGELLSKMIEFIQIYRESSYLTFFKKAPQKGRFLARDLQFLRKALIKEIELVNPQKVLIMSNKAAQLILDLDAPFDHQGILFGNKHTYTTYHPRQLTDDNLKREAVGHLTQLKNSY